MKTLWEFAVCSKVSVLLLLSFNDEHDFNFKEEKPERLRHIPWRNF
jgi:hypothetical protein